MSCRQYTYVGPYLKLDSPHEMSDELWGTGEQKVWIPADKKLGVSVEYDHPEGDDRVTVERLEHEVDLFKDRYAIEIATVEKLGIPAAVHWGVVTYWY